MQVRGGKFELTQNDIEELTSIYFGKPKSKGDIALRGLNIEILNSEVYVKAPIIYNRFNLLLTSTGKIVLSNGAIVYVPDNFKMGKLIVPKNLIIYLISNLNNKIIYIQDNTIKIRASMLPFKILNFKIIDNKILVTAMTLDTKMLLENLNKSNMGEIDKQIVTLEQNIQNFSVLMNEEEKEKIKTFLNTLDSVKGKSIEEKKRVIRSVINKLDKVISDSRESTKNKVLQKLKTDDEIRTQKQRLIRRATLIKTRDELKNAYSQVVTLNEQRLIEEISLTLSKMIANSSYNSTLDKITIKSMYGALNSTSKDRVKSALFWNI